MVSSPFLLAATIEHHIDSYVTDNAETLKNDIYVDNVITGKDMVEEVKCLYNDAKPMFNDKLMNLRDWVANKGESTIKFLLMTEVEANLSKCWGINGTYMILFL